MKVRLPLAQNDPLQGAQRTNTTESIDNRKGKYLKENNMQNKLNKEENILLNQQLE